MNVKNVIGIIAATDTDTVLGVDYFKKKGINSIGISISKTPQEQTLLQIKSRKELTNIVLSVAKRLQKKGVTGIVIYCNSLSGVIDINKIRSKLKIPIITPLDVYRVVAKTSDCFGVLAANCQSTKNIESVIIKANSRSRVLGYGNLSLVDDIESNKKPKDLIKDHSLLELCKIFQKEGVESIILGCTHFIVFYDELKKISPLPIIDPSELMFKILFNKIAKNK